MYFLAGLILGALAIFLLRKSKKSEARKKLEKVEWEKEKLRIIVNRYASTIEFIKTPPCKGKQMTLLTVDGRKTWYRVRIEEDPEKKYEDVVIIMRRATENEIEDVKKNFPSWCMMRLGENALFGIPTDGVLVYKPIPRTG